MAKRVTGTFVGTGSTVYVGCGFMPDWVRVIALGHTALPQVQWASSFTAPSAIEGYLDADGATAHAPLAVGEGIAPFCGGNAITADNQSAMLVPDWRDYRAVSAEGGDAVNEPIRRWTLDTLADRTGHFNADVVGDHIGPGSRVIINGVEYIITDLTPGEGSGDDEVTLNAAAPSGEVQAISNRVSFVAGPIGLCMPAGFRLAVPEGSPINNEDEVQWFEAGTND